MRGIVVDCNKQICRVGKSWRELGYFAVSDDLAGVAASCDRAGDSANRTPCPLRLVWGTDARAKMKRCLKLPKPLPLDKPVGPTPAPKDWTYLDGLFT
eukprot:8889347-Pyramimonas_sp.AAC.2